MRNVLTAVGKATFGPSLLFEETEIRVNWQWCLRLALIQLVGWLMLFALIFLIANYMQEVTPTFLED
jgi:hypothetical protein